MSALDVDKPAEFGSVLISCIHWFADPADLTSSITTDHTEDCQIGSRSDGDHRRASLDAMTENRSGRFVTQRRTVIITRHLLTRNQNPQPPNWIVETRIVQGC